jgi:hypothetical protein
MPFDVCLTLSATDNETIVVQCLSEHKQQQRPSKINYERQWVWLKANLGSRCSQQQNLSQNEFEPLSLVGDPFRRLSQQLRSVCSTHNEARGVHST